MIGRKTVLCIRLSCMCQTLVLFFNILCYCFCSLHRISYHPTMRFFFSFYSADIVFYLFCRSIFDTKKLLEFAKLGCYLEYDLFGTEFIHYQFQPDIDMPSDNDRIARYLLQCGLSNSIAIDKLILLVYILKSITEQFYLQFKIVFSHAKIMDFFLLPSLL